MLFQVIVHPESFVYIGCYLFYSRSMSNSPSCRQSYAHQVFDLQCTPTLFLRCQYTCRCFRKLCSNLQTHMCSLNSRQHIRKHFGGGGLVLTITDAKSELPSMSFAAAGSSQREVRTDVLIAIKSAHSNYFLQTLLDDDT